MNGYHISICICVLGHTATKVTQVDVFDILLRFGAFEFSASDITFAIPDVPKVKWFSRFTGSTI